MYELIPISIIVVSGVLLFPVVVSSAIRRLRQTPHVNARSPEIARLEAELHQTREELQRLSERQQFIEALLEKRGEQSSLPR
jgi:hypothetical protein